MNELLEYEYWLILRTGYRHDEANQKIKKYSFHIRFTDKVSNEFRYQQMYNKNKKKTSYMLIHAVFTTVNMSSFFYFYVWFYSFLP